MKTKLFLLALALMLLPTSSEAAVVLVGDKISIEADEVIEDDYYVSVGSLGTTYMSGVVKGDMHALGGSVTANGVIEGDFGAISGLSYMHASVTDDVRIIAGEAVIDDYVGGDVFVMGGVLKILSSARIEGDVIFYGFEGEISGEVGGSVYGSANSLRIDSKIGGDVDVNVNGNLTLGSKAEIAGDVRYRGTNNLVRAQDSVVAGEIQKNAPATDPEASPLRNTLIPLFISLFATLTLYLLFKREMQLTIKTIMDAPLQASFIGLATILVGPFVSLLLVSTVLGMLLGVFGIGAILMLIAIGFTMAIVFTGALVSRLVLGTATISLLWIIIGALVFHAALLIPYIGLTLALTLISLAVGGVLVTLYRRAR